MAFGFITIHTYIQSLNISVLWGNKSLRVETFSVPQEGYYFVSKEGW
jgi:hypothetical protein